MALPSLYAQELKTYTVNPGQKIYDAIGPVERYAYPEFESGLVNFRNGRHKKELEKYLDERRPDFMKEDDMRAMLVFLAQLN